MSSDISHSMSRILPRTQNLLPVCLKRKLEYTGNYIEEIIDKNKVNAYFNFFKRYNPLFNNIELKESKIDQYETEASVAVEMFNDATNNLNSGNDVHDESQEVEDKDEYDENEDGGEDEDEEEEDDVDVDEDEYGDLHRAELGMKNPDPDMNE